MWLRYGIDINDTLVAIKDLPGGGKTELLCPYCNAGLTAKKGKIKTHHFAHTAQTCRSVAGRSSQDIPTLPLYDNFHVRLLGKELEQLKVLWKEYGAKGYTVPKYVVPRRFVLLGLLRKAESSDDDYDYEFTQLGQIPLGELDLASFSSVQESLMLEKLSELEKKAEHTLNSNSLFLQEQLTDLKLYCAQIKRVLSQALYFLEIEADGQILHKIGVTVRPIEERVTEVKRDLSKHFKSILVRVIGTWERRGNIEFYFKHRYQDFNYKIGSLTEYYYFNNFKNMKLILRELQQLELKILSEVEALFN